MDTVMQNLFGSYNPIVVETIQDGISIEVACVDYAYFAGIALFAITLFCVFKLIGGLFRAR